MQSSRIDEIMGMTIKRILVILTDLEPHSGNSASFGDNSRGCRPSNSKALRLSAWRGAGHSI